MKTKALPLCLAFFMSFLLIFIRLSHYSLWDDEANTALHAMGVWQTGDTTAVIGSNIVAYRGGVTLTNLRERYIPPFSYYIAALPVGLSGGGAWAARAPFALCGLACAGLMLFWAWREQLSNSAYTLIFLALTGNVSFYLYSRQCRYYAVAMFATVALAYLYRFRMKGMRWAVCFSLVSIVLFATNYMNYLAFYICAAIDYLAWGRKDHRLTVRQYVILVLPQLVACPAIASVWNPLTKSVVPYQTSNWLGDKLTLLWWSWRDLVRCEFGVALLLIAAPAVALICRELWLMRASIALATYIAVVVVVSPQPVGVTFLADVRYFSPIIPLCIAIEVFTLVAIGRQSKLTMVPLGVIAFWTSLLPWGRDWEHHQVSTLGEYVHELADPPADPYTIAVQWFNEHALPGQTVFVLPNHMCYSLMYHAPWLTYAWQLRPPVDEQFDSLPPIHFFGGIPPDYVVLFGPDAREAWREITPPAQAHYQEVARQEFFWDQMHRPELFWRTFRKVDSFNVFDESIFIYRRLSQGRRALIGKSEKL